MALFKVEHIKSEEELILDKEGKIVPREVKLQGKRVFVPVNDAAKAMANGCQEAIDLGIYKPAKGETPEEMKKKLRKREDEFAKLGKGLPT